MLSACLIAVGILSIYSRMHQIHLPNHACWDEVHYSKMASYYNRHTFFFDVHPPFGKMLICGLIHMSGHNNSIFNENSLEFHPEFPYSTLRCFSALISSLMIVMVAYDVYIMTSSLRTSLLSACLIIFDVSILVMNRLITLEPLLYFFTALSITFFLHSIPYKKSFNGVTLSCTFATGVSLGLLNSTKHVGLLTWSFFLILTLWILLNMLSDPLTSLKRVAVTTALCATTYVIVPIIIYTFLFHLHFKILYKSGPDDAMFTPFFQSSLLYNRHQNISASFITYGSDVVLKNAKGASLSFRHADNHHHPNRVVTSLNLDGEHLWSFETIFDDAGPHSDIFNTFKSNKNRFVENGHIVRLKQKKSQLYLRISADQQRQQSQPLQGCNKAIFLQKLCEHAGNETNFGNYSEDGENYDEYCGSAFQETLFRLQIDYKSSQQISTIVKQYGVGRDDDDSERDDDDSERDDDDSERKDDGVENDDHLKLKQFVHVFQLQAIISDEEECCFLAPTNQQTCSQCQHLAWHEDLVTCSRCVATATWYVERAGEDAADGREKTNVSGSSVHQLRRLSFFEKFFEVHKLMFTLSNKLKARPCEVHSSAISWFFSLQFQPISDDHLIYLVGNPFIWWPSSIIIAILPPVSIFIFHVQRRCAFIKDEKVLKHMYTCVALLLAWCLHYMPYLLVNRVLYIHHYLVAALFKIVCAGVACSCCQSVLFKTLGKIKEYYENAATVTIISLLAYSFIKFSPLAYGIHKNSVDDEIFLINWLENVQCSSPFHYEKINC